MYELIILSLLMRNPAHGYLIARVINDIIGPVARASNGRIYPLLARLVESGLVQITEEEAEGRQTRTYAITEAGRRRFHALMTETEVSPREYQELFSFKVTVFALISPAERRSLIQHYREFCLAHIRHLQGALQMLAQGGREGPPPAHAANLLSVLQHRLHQWELEANWTESLLAANTQEG